MTGRIIDLHSAEHRQAQDLLPWYLTGKLAAPEKALVEAHLAACSTCQADLRLEGRLKAEIAALPEVEHGWAAMRRRVERDQARGPWAALTAWLVRVGARPQGFRWVGWALAAQGVLVVFAGALVLSSGRTERYHVLGAPFAAASGNLVVIFRPEASELHLRTLLNDNHARLVDGPTAADAYVLHVPGPARAAALASLRRSADVVLAEPIDPTTP
jgi:anti-sigma factor RsiW